jgi:hypothetical protein
VTAPRRVPAVGQILDLAAGQVLYVDYPMRIRVCRPRRVCCWSDPRWVWVQAEILGPDDRLVDVRPVAVLVDAIPEAP